MHRVDRASIEVASYMVASSLSHSLSADHNGRTSRAQSQQSSRRPSRAHTPDYFSLSEDDYVQRTSRKSSAQPSGGGGGGGGGDKAAISAISAESSISAVPTIEPSSALYGRLPQAPGLPTLQEPSYSESAISPPASPSVPVQACIMSASATLTYSAEAGRQTDRTAARSATHNCAQAPAHANAPAHGYAHGGSQASSRPEEAPPAVQMPTPAFEESSRQEMPQEASPSRLQPSRPLEISIAEYGSDSTPACSSTTSTSTTPPSRQQTAPRHLRKQSSRNLLARTQSFPPDHRGRGERQKKKQMPRRRSSKEARAQASSQSEEGPGSLVPRVDEPTTTPSAHGWKTSTPATGQQEQEQSPRTPSRTGVVLTRVASSVSASFIFLRYAGSPPATEYPASKHSSRDRSTPSPFFSPWKPKPKAAWAAAGGGPIRPLSLTVAVPATGVGGGAGEEEVVEVVAEISPAWRPLDEPLELKTQQTWRASEVAVVAAANAESLLGVHRGATPDARREGSPSPVTVARGEAALRV